MRCGRVPCEGREHDARVGAADSYGTHVESMIVSRASAPSADFWQVPAQFSPPARTGRARRPKADS
jgi:hypothetical protein